MEIMMRVMWGLLWLLDDDDDGVEKRRRRRNSADHQDDNDENWMTNLTKPSHNFPDPPLPTKSP